ncbi:MAG: hypothetical protein BGP23_07330 [Lysobacterales bacterium 66-474]|nr:MAG: hypothetical protein ABT18_00025 [Rhodanobacter sp. SCN 66-43]OJY82892.1 MAG: hypothetical protein BGP23_07330 [Xanthomonadales bacterium 66-474]
MACYRHCFIEEAAFACDLDDLADDCAGFLRLTRFWLDEYPAQVFDLQYEALVADPEDAIRRMLDFCGLLFDPACLEPREAARDELDRLRRRLRGAGVPLE